MALLTMVSISAWAQIDVQIANDGKFDGGTIKYIEQTKPDEKGNVTVTITVTPNKEKGYTISKKDITVVSTYPPSGPNANTRTPEIADNLTLYFKGSADADTDDLSAERDYTFNVPSGFGAWVKEANFQSSGKKGGDEPTRADYSGVYYIANDNSASGSDDATTYSSATDAQKYYLVPAANPKQSDYRDAYYSPNHATTPGDPEKPFLTTFHTNKDLNSVWIVKKTDNYYHVIHAITGKYVIYEVPLPNDPNKNNDSDQTKNGKRKTMHLQTPDDGTYSLNTNNNYQFNITLGSSIYRIQPRNRSGWYWNPANGNKNQYYGQTETIYQSGLIGVYNNQNDGGSKWHFEDAKLPAPTIEYDSDNEKFTISYDKIPAGFEILYTTDGSDPAIGGSTTQEYTSESVITLNSIATNPLKAVVVRYGLILTETAIIRKPANPTITPTPGDCNNTVTISTEEGTSVYYTIDGTDPTNSSTLYTGPFILNSDATIKAVAYSGNLHSEVISFNYSPNYSAKPTITQNGATITISGSGTIYYTINGNDPDTGSTLYNGSFTLSGNSGDVITVKAVAKDGNKGLSCIVERNVKMGYFIGDLSQLEAISSHPSDLCILTADIDASNFSASISGFTGEFDGSYYTISGLTKPLFDNLNGATVKNVVLDPNGTVSGNGAICNEAEGATKIYNCGVLSGTVSGSSGNVGGLVGHIKSGSSVRVVNCYNFATVSGGSTMAGIVGNNEGTVGDVRIAMCMMYGDMAGTSPVYAGNHTSNASNFTEYNYWRSKANLTYTTYNDQLAIDKDDYLARFPFYRHILNTHRELAAFFLFGESSETVNDITTDEVAEIGHWVLNKDVAPYPIIEEWKENTRKVLDAAAEPTTTVNVCKGSGSAITSLNVTVKIGSNTYSNVYLPITGMDEANYDYTWGKVVLPFANEFEVNTDYSKICTGWKITSITGGTNGSSFNNYDVSDRDCTSKDLYSTTGFVFAQGGNYIVPYNVTGIEITANFANAYYLSDESYEIGYSGDKTGSNVSGYTGRTTLGGNTPATYHSYTVYHTLANALSAMSASGSTHEQAVVLVGNYHQDDEDLKNHTSKGLTIMSIDADNNQEPDYAWYSNNTQDRPIIPPTRFDFMAMIPVGMSSRVNNTTFYPGIPIWKSHGWFEMTETSLSKMDQFELNSNNFDTSDNDTRNYRCIINGGYFTQMVRSRKAACNKVKYYQIGGNAYVKEFYPGSHSADNYATVLCPINVTGGEIEQCFMTGFGKGTAVGSDIYFWCAGGKIDKFLGAYMENPSTAGVNMTAKIDHAKIGRIFGGGTSPKAQITGNIDVTINNSHVDFYCGGPEFGNMSDGKTVTTHATNTVFEQYYGAGFGGTAITYKNDIDDNSQGIGGTSKPTVTYPSSFLTTYYSGSGKARLKYETGYGIGSCYKLEFLFNSRGAGSVARFYTGYAQFDLATTGSVTNNLTGCTVNGDFYGAGCQGKVNGTVTSTLSGCTIYGSAFGGGFKATANEVDIYPASAPEMSVYTRETGIFSDFGTVEPEKYTWKQGTNEKKNTVEGTTLYTGTNVTLADLGNVTGAISITIDGGSIADDVFGGGNESKSLNNTTVSIENGAQIAGSVYGGGNEADVQGNTNVNITGGTITQNVFGGGKGEADHFECKKAMVGIDGDGTNNPDGGTTVNITAGTVKGNVYGGGEVGRVEKNTSVTIGTGEGSENNSRSPIIEGSVFGAGAGVKTHGYSALVRGNSTVTVQGNAWVKKSVYGGGEIASVGRYNVVDGLPTTPISGGECFVNILGCAEIGPNGMLMTADGGPDDAGHVFGAGKGVLPYEGYEDDEEPQHMDGHKDDNDKWVDDPKSYTAYGSLGGNEDANYSKFLHTLALSSETHVTIDGNAFIKGSVYGGGENGFVQANTYVTIAGGQIGCGKNTTERYSDDVWKPGYVPTTDLECASWTFGDGKPYDKYAGAAGYDAKEGALVATDGHTFYGNVFAGGSGYYPYRPGKWFQSAGRVNGNTNLTITGGHILTNVYGGNEMTDVVGSCTINMSGGTVGVPRTYEQMRAHPVTCYIFGAGKGDPRVFFNTWTNVGSTQVNISGSARIYGSTFGGGEDGHVLGDAETNINTGSDVPVGTGESATTLRYPYIGTTGTSAVDGNIFGGGRGYSENALTAGVVCGNVRVNIHDGTILGSIFGGGRLASVGTHLAAADNTDYYGTMIPDGKQQVIGGADVDDSSENPATHGHITITIDGGSIGAVDNAGKLVNSNYTIGDVFGGSKGSSTDKRFGFAKSTSVTISEPNAEIPTRINRSVFGGGEAGNVEGDVAVTLNGGIVGEDLYGGGALADTNIGNWNATLNEGAGGFAEGIVGEDGKTKYKTEVNLLGGTIKGDAFGGGLGQKTGFNGGTSNIEATTYGDITVTLGKEDKSSATAFNTTYENTDEKDENNQFIKVVKSGRLFGTNNLNGSPKGNVMVNVYCTQNKLMTTIAEKFIREKDSDIEKEENENTEDYVTRLKGILTGKIALAEALNISVSSENKALCTDDNAEAPALKTAITSITTSIDGKTTEEINGVRYDMAAVYGGGNLADYTTAGKKASVIIHTCDVSVQDVYGGGNAASVPETDVLVKGAYEIEHVFGGGNGKDKFKKGNTWMANDGADVLSDANTLMIGGYIHEAYGGSNEKGKIHGSVHINSNAKDPDCDCVLELESFYTAGNNADVDGDAIAVVDCMPDKVTPEIYGGAKNANVKGNVELTIRGGTFGKVFGGNNQSGAIFGHIILNIEETNPECSPIIIDELYGCGNMAAYSVYGYYQDGTDENGYPKYVPRTSANDHVPVTFEGKPHTNPNAVANKYQYDDPVLNIISCTRIGKVFGGGLGSGAVVYGNPTVNINQMKGVWAGKTYGTGDDALVIDDDLGKIGDVFGGGNEAEVHGNTTVNIGTATTVQHHLSYNKDTGVYTMSEPQTVLGANIVGNVYGGGNKANVTGNTNVNIGKAITTTP